MNQLQVRLLDYSADVMRLSDGYSQRSSFGRMIDQLNRSSSAIGANYSEAQSAASSKDFHNKIRISLKEAREAEYWLELMQRRDANSALIKPLIGETIQIIRILTAIANKAKSTPKF